MSLLGIQYHSVLLGPAVASGVAQAGLYGLLAQLVAQRTREIGVRIALGASRSLVVWLVIRQAAEQRQP